MKRNQTSQLTIVVTAFLAIASVFCVLGLVATNYNRQPSPTVLVSDFDRLLQRLQDAGITDPPSFNDAGTARIGDASIIQFDSTAKARSAAADIGSGCFVHDVFVISGSGKTYQRIRAALGY